MTSAPSKARVRRRGRRIPGAVIIALIAMLALLAIPLVVFVGGEDSAVDGTSAAPSGLRSTLTVPEPPTGVQDGSRPSPQDLGRSADGTGEFVQNSTGSQVTYLSLRDGFHAGTATERFARPSLSLIKLYIADYVLDHGTLEEQYQAIAMVSSSSDETANQLHRKYPGAIDEVAEKYSLLSTRSNERWGYSVTSTYDVVTFVAELIRQDPTHPILVAMAGADRVAADGYDQDFGTAVLPGVLGTKFGWSDARDLHASVSFGEDFVVAAAVTGSAEDLTALVEHQLEDLPATR